MPRRTGSAGPVLVGPHHHRQVCAGTPTPATRTHRPHHRSQPGGEAMVTVNCTTTSTARPDSLTRPVAKLPPPSRTFARGCPATPQAQEDSGPPPSQFLTSVVSRAGHRSPRLSTGPLVGPTTHEEKLMTDSALKDWYLRY